MKARLLLILVVLMALCAAQSKPEGYITTERIVAACKKVRTRYVPCYATRAVPKPKPCAREMDLLQKALPVIEQFATLSAAFKGDQNRFNTEPARDFVETVEGWR